MLTLGLETSCDETSASIVEDGQRVVSLSTLSSIKDFAGLGGVIPEQAARRQLEVMTTVIDQALTHAKCRPENIDLFAVTNGPGLLGSLLVGTTTARALAAVWGCPLIGVHHTLGHLASTWLLPRGATDAALYPLPTFPILTLSVSGGHSDLWLRTSHTHGERIGTTIDDAAGEAFDKGAALLGLPYPGGPALSHLAQGGDEHAHAFAMPLAHEHSLNFSFSGLKTALKYLLRDLVKEHEKQEVPEKVRRNSAASYERAICSHLLKQTERTLQAHTDIRELHIVGGVSANRRLRLMAEESASRYGIILRFPSELVYCTDNGAMIAAAGFFLAQEKPEFIGAPFRTQATVDLLRVFWKTQHERDARGTSRNSSPPAPAAGLRG